MKTKKMARNIVDRIIDTDCSIEESYERVLDLLIHDENKKLKNTVMELMQEYANDKNLCPECLSWNITQKYYNASRYNDSEYEMECHRCGYVA
jgi:hypothetical protein